MWTRKELKDRAKAVLREIYWGAFGVSILIALAASSGNLTFKSDVQDFKNSMNYLFPGTIFAAGLIETLLIYSIFISLALVAFRIFIGYSLEIGGTKYFVQSAQYKDKSNCISFGFKKENYGGIVKTMFIRALYTLLWTLLFIIPGIVKSYAYSMVPYILADNPNIGVNEAISLSNQMTKGHKWSMFVLDLSFIGWYLLGALALGIGTFFVWPYDNATKAELYLTLRQDALESNLCSAEHLLLDGSETFNEDNHYTW